MKTIVVVINVYGDKVILVLFSDRQDNESESQGMEISVSRSICTHKIIHGPMGIDGNYLFSITTK